VDDNANTVDNSLETGVIDLGSADGSTGSAYADDSLGVYYGGGRQYEDLEVPSITKVTGRKDKSNGHF
jgi:hypothetical protein